ncbi:SDR family NAD(P)-dependent oxidoreductase [Cecembia calidifontis]|jgi:benzil reductase ((S)-benzoin forming)|uniref:Benzil reductase ((S)-benzoin forming) n=1 Tax=Cecembia calidifontis TaxID=1187080 RepID=A0A4Q7P8V0_9BACT|nr:SDR family NAD(P)-dependent oxidoreductase [Cecembia calidifontis]RZS96603.1 benzil reductase ((S)-benzoin forming) [Cecembia calidifontis]
MSIACNLFIVTGSSKGIGRALVELLLKDQNNKVIGISRSQKPIAGPGFSGLNLDLSDMGQIIENLEKIFPNDNFRKIVLINNAGWIGEIKHLGKLDPESIRKIFMLNTVAPTILMNTFIQRFAHRKDAERLIINISSGAAKKAIDGWACYSASKAAINMLSEAASLEASLDKTGIRVFSVAPGVVDTDMQSEIRSADEGSFSSLSKFVGLKENNLLSTAEYAAQKLLELIRNPDRFQTVLQDVREY